jgi:hypothetical protein
MFAIFLNFTLLISRTTNRIFILIYKTNFVKEKFSYEHFYCTFTSNEQIFQCLPLEGRLVLFLNYLLLDNIII